MLQSPPAPHPSTATAPPSPAGGGISLTTATALAIADMIGIGVFTSLGFQVQGLPSPFAIMMLWVLGGLVALCGALCYAELATAMPRSGGEYTYLTRIYNGAVGFLAGWISASVGFAAPVALAAMAFGTYLDGVAPGVMAPWVAALLLIAAVTLVHLRGVEHGSRFQNVSTWGKVGLIIAFIIAGLALGERQPISFAPTAQDARLILSAPFAIGLVFVMYSYSGWNAVTYVASEVREPQSVLPRSIAIAVAVVATLYVALNAVFLITTPMGKLAGQIDVGLVAGREIFGASGGRIVGALICIGLVSAVSAMMWIGPRVAMVMGEDFPVLAPLARRSARGTPVNATLLQAGVASLLLVTRSFESVLEFIQFGLMASSFLAVLGVVVLRVREPDLPRPFRLWAYPLAPLIFLAVTGWMMVYLLIDKPKESLSGLGLLLAGLAIHALSTRRRAPADPN